MKSHPETVHISFRREDFRFGLERPFWPVACGALLVAEVLSLPLQASLPHHRMFVIPAAVLTSCAIALWIMAKLYRLEIGPDGIHWHDFWLRPRRASWKSIRRTRLVHLLGMDYLCVETHNSRWAMWVPLFVTQYRRLRDLLVTYADDTQRLDDRLDEDY